MFAGKPWTHLEILLVRVETDDGLVGWGEAFGHAAIASTKAALDTIVAPLVVGRDAGDINNVTRDILHSVHLLGRNGPFVYAFSGVEIALWDILGKRTGQPLYRLLGGRKCTQLAAYSSLLHYGNPARVSENTRAACAQGFQHIKLHEVTRENVLAASGAAANARIMLDVNCAWSVPAARDMARSLVNGSKNPFGLPKTATDWPRSAIAEFQSRREKTWPACLVSSRLSRQVPSTLRNPALPRSVASASCFG